MQTILPSLLFAGREPPSKSWRIHLKGNDYLSCEVSTPLIRERELKTVILIHGLGGSHASSYMIRMARRLYLKGYKVVRVNLRGCGSGKGLSALSYHGGNSEDILRVILSCKENDPDSPLILVGFSLGGNIALKLVGELGEAAPSQVKSCIAVCPPVHLENSVLAIGEKRNRLYEKYYLRHLRKQMQGKPLQRMTSLYEFDEFLTAPSWGYKGAFSYYESCSSLQFLPNIRIPTRLLFAKDDPFVNYKDVEGSILLESTKVFISENGGHMGFIGKKNFYFMDQLLEDWIEDS